VEREDEEAFVRKRLDRFALTLWLLAAIVVTFDAGFLFLLRNVRPYGVEHSTYYVVIHLRPLLFEDVRAVAMLVGLGMIIEMLDQIRWNALQK